MKNVYCKIYLVSITSQAKPSQAKPSQAKPSQAKPKIKNIKYITFIIYIKSLPAYIKINIYIYLYNNYISYSISAVTSILENEKLVFNLINAEIKKKILDIKNIKECEINFYTPDIKMYDEWFEKYSCKAHLSAAMFYRFSISNIIPSNIYKILYLNSDLIVTGSLKEL
ncbi:glycosyltransferase [Brachyspira hyodysenteriae]|uniref:glycosyltransferase n=1 Tax=Brachyspira hyodysenteriae TaxID=159 RepID=UPI00203CE55B|nr:glycosyltransferase [Brachyspira hyodysenteriae]MDA0062219.1 hypothetical protein [Brachyspira hyodysenteriae]